LYYKKLSNENKEKLDSLATKVGLSIITDFLEIDIFNEAIKNFSFINYQNISDEEKNVLIQFKKIIKSNAI
jgi:hypothetical protein